MSVRNVRYLSTAIVVCFWRIVAADPSAAEAQAQIQEWIDDYPGVAAAVAKGDAIIWSGGWGYADLDSEIEATPDTLFNVYSVAKMFNGAALGILAENGQIDLDRPVTEYVGGLADVFQSVTPRQLAGHLGGVGHYGPDPDWSEFSQMHCKQPEDALQHFVHRPLVAEPGTTHVYTSYGQVLLSAVIGAASPQGDYLKFMQVGVFAPAGMERTRIDSHNMPAGIKAVGYRERFWMWFSAIDDLDASCKFGGGGFVSSASDLARFGMALYQDKLFSRATLEEISTSFVLPDGTDTFYAFGMTASTLERFQRPVPYVLHSGGSPGGRAFILVLPEEKIAVGMAGNYDGERMTEATISLAALFAGLERKDTD